MESNLQLRNCHPRIIEGVADLMINTHTMYYGFFAQHLTFQESKRIKTAAVTVKWDGLYFYWNREFIDKLDNLEIRFLIIHEIFHLLWDHISRTKTRDRKLSNIAQDMIINEIIINEYQNITYPVAKFIECGITMVPDYDLWAKEVSNNTKASGDRIYELFYDFLEMKKVEYNKWCEGKREEKGKTQNASTERLLNILDKNPDKIDEEKPEDMSNEDWKDVVDDLLDIFPYDETCPCSQELKKIFDGSKYNDGIFLDEHLDSEMSKEMRDCMIDRVKNSLKNRGLEAGNMESILSKLKKSKKDYLKEIKRSLETLKMAHKVKSVRRSSRRVPELKGKIKIGAAINCILDTSGSMSNEFEVVLSYIFQDNLFINMIQVDTQVQSVQTINRKSQIQKMQISGLGGTDLQEAVDLIIKNKWNDLGTVILTDGYIGTLDVTKLKKSLVISTGVKANLIGNARQILVDNNYE